MNRRIFLYAIVGLILANSVFLASANVLTQTAFFSSGRFVFQYDETKLVVDRVGDFSYDSEGNIQQLAIYVKNRDSSNAYSGFIDATIGSQAYNVTVNLSAGATKSYSISLSPHLPVTEPIVLSINVLITGAGSGADLIAQKGAAIPDASIDGTKGAEWNDAKSYTNVPITPSGTANIWVKNDGTNLYIALQFTADSNNPWVAFQLGATGSHPTGADGGLFGDDNYAANGYKDVRIISDGITVDATQNGGGAITVGTGNLATIEYKKPLNSGDSAGGDINWSVGSTYNLVIVWDSNGGGSSGGSTSHRSATPIARTIQIGA